MNTENIDLLENSEELNMEDELFEPYGEFTVDDIADGLFGPMSLT